MKKNKTTKSIEEDNSMNDLQMNRLLIELYDTQQWKALKRFIDIEMIKAASSLCSIDILKNSTEALRMQGIRIGLYSIVQYIEMIFEKSKNKGKDEESKTPNYNNF